MTRITISINEPKPHPEALLIVADPFPDWVKRCSQCDFGENTRAQKVQAVNSEQTGFLLDFDTNNPPDLIYTFDVATDASPDWVWNVDDNKFTRPSADLSALAKEITCEAMTDKARIQALADYAGQTFGYGHTDDRFYGDKEDIPAVCGTTKGSCVDINTFLLAASRALNIKAQYVAGYWFHPEKSQTLDMHCWMAFQADGETIFWDVAHHLKWGVEGPLRPGLNPAKGRRVPMSVGRGLCFETPHGEVTLNHFAEPQWVLPNGNLLYLDLVAKMEDPVHG